MDISFITSIAGQIKDAFRHADEQGRRQITDALREIQYSVEPPEETMQRIIHQNLTIAMVYTALDLKIYDTLVASKEPMSLQALAKKTRADPVLLGRIMRHQSSMGIVRETDKDNFEANNVTRNLAIPEIQSGIYYNNNVLGPVYQDIPTFLRKTNYRNPSDGLDTTFQSAWKTEVAMWTWLHKHPFETSHFNNFMRAQRMSTPNCFQFVDLSILCGDWPSDRPVFVDVGGGTGHQCIAVKERFPDLPGRIILQDLPAPIAEAKLPEGIEKMAHDFFTPQPIKNAKFYYLRAILHDHSDVASLKILRHIYDAMDHDSVLLLDEMVLPNTNVDWYATQTDLTMMVAFASMERTRNAWTELLDKAGMKIREMTTYTHAFRLSVVEVVKKAD